MGHSRFDVTTASLPQYSHNLLMLLLLLQPINLDHDPALATEPLQENLWIENLWIDFHDLDVFSQ